MNPQEYFRAHDYQQSRVLYLEQDRDLTLTLVVRFAGVAPKTAESGAEDVSADEATTAENEAEFHRIQFLQARNLHRSGTLHKTGFQGFDPRYIGVSRTNRIPAILEALTVSVSRGNWTVHLNIGLHGTFEFSCKSISVRTRTLRKTTDNVWADAATGVVLNPTDPFAE